MAKPKAVPFEKSKTDKEVKGKGKEGSKREEAFDRMQAKKAPTKGFVKAMEKQFPKGATVSPTK